MRGRCQRCLFAGELVGVTYALTNGTPVRRRLCEHCALHDDTPSITCPRCFPAIPSKTDQP